VRWLASEGQAVAEGDDLLEILTEKVNATVRAPAAGVLGRVAAAEGTTLPVGALLGLIGAPGDSFPSPEQLRTAPAAPAGGRAGDGAGSSALGRPATAAAGAEEPVASPSARRLASELGIDIRRVEPSAPGRRITSEDVEAYAAALPKGRVVPFEGVRALVAENLTESLRTMAQVTVTRETTVTGLVARRAELAPKLEAAGLHLTYTDLLIEAVVALLKEQPVFNSTLTDTGIVLLEAINIGFAVALEDGLIVPVIKGAGELGLDRITRARTELAERATAGTLGLEEIEGGSFTITNLGAFGADAFTPIINPSQAAILGVGRILERPVVVAGEVKVAPTMWLSLTIDHRIIDGAPAARFLQTLAERLA
jgi:pyruvate dehydrogenase E2 component (dihydrolipoamide acetyltransferase)